jgi:uncharacterized glyoxalase superfamily protein PhnB
MPIEVDGVAPLLSVFDMPRAIRFYRDVLGFKVVGNSPALSDNPDDVDWAMLRLNGATIMLNGAYEAEYRPAAPNPEHFKVHRDTCLYFGCPDVDGAYQYLCSKGLVLKEPKIAHYGMKQLYLTDPDGYNICFQWPA